MASLAVTKAGGVGWDLFWFACYFFRLLSPPPQPPSFSRCCPPFPPLRVDILRRKGTSEWAKLSASCGITSSWRAFFRTTTSQSRPHCSSSRFGNNRTNECRRAYDFFIAVLTVWLVPFLSRQWRQNMVDLSTQTQRMPARGSKHRLTLRTPNAVYAGGIPNCVHR